MSTDDLIYTEFAEYNAIIRGRLSDFRYHHSMCVARRCVELCEMYGGDKRQMYLAGLLHDITKEADEKETFKIFANGGYAPTELEKRNHKVWHQISGSLYARDVLKIDDQSIISSIRYHTTLHTNPTHEEKLLFIADFTSSDRDFDDVDVVREKSNRDLDEAIIYSLSYTIKELAETEKCIHPDTIGAYNSIILNNFEKR